MRQLHLLIYNISVVLYGLFIHVASLFNSKAKYWVKGRRLLFQKMKKELKPHEQRVWIHCASLGEFEQARPIIESIKKEYPDIKLLLTFFSPSGYEIRKNYAFADYIFYLPLDIKSNAEKFIKLTRPHLAIFVKYEFWYHHINILKKYNIPVMLISAIFQSKQIFFKWYGVLFRVMLNNFEKVFVQDEPSQRLLHSIGTMNTDVVSDTRIDSVLQVSKQPQPFEIVKAFKQNKRILIAGSTYAQEENILISFMQDHDLDIKYIIVPHEIRENNINRLQTLISKPTVRYTKANKENIKDASVLIVDTIGMLIHLYQYAEFALIGGGFGKGIHNILEPVAFGLPVLFGPNYYKFKEARDLNVGGGAFVFKNYEEFKKQFLILFNEHAIYSEASKNCSEYIVRNAGGTDKIMYYLRNFITG